MAFENLSDKLQNVFKKLRGKGILTEADVDVALKEVRMALLEADVNFKIVKQFNAAVKERAIGEDVMTKGTVNGALISPREIYIQALRRGAVGIVLLHNHPSGDPRPSREDITSTRQIKRAGDLIGIGLLDHIIISNQSIFSFAEERTITI